MIYFNFKDDVTIYKNFEKKCTRKDLFVCCRGNAWSFPKNRQFIDLFYLAWRYPKKGKWNGRCTLRCVAVKKGRQLLWAFALFGFLQTQNCSIFPLDVNYKINKKGPRRLDHNKYFIIPKC
jgi:hypothetical protein